MAEEKPKALLTGELASRAGVKTDTVRFYERTDLLSGPARRESRDRT